MRIRNLIVPGALLCQMVPSLITPAIAGTAPSTTVARLTLGTAIAMAQAAIDACRAKGYEVAATVVDRDGITQAALRDTLASPLTLTMSYDKAYTSAMFNASGSALQQQPRLAPLAQAGAHLVFAAGSVPIDVGGIFYGAIGVSGTPSGETDEACANAGLAAVHDDLDMQ